MLHFFAELKQKERPWRRRRSGSLHARHRDWSRDWRNGSSFSRSQIHSGRGRRVPASCSQTGCSQHHFKVYFIIKSSLANSCKGIEIPEPSECRTFIFSIQMDFEKRTFLTPPYSGDLKTDHLNTRNISILKFGFQMVGLVAMSNVLDQPFKY